jgi:hypothetical protein
VHSYNVSSGAYVASGTTEWLNRTVRFNGSVNAPAGNCAKMEVLGMHQSQSQTQSRETCASPLSYAFSIKWDVPGGVSSAVFHLYRRSTDTTKWSLVASKTCTRSGC